MPLPVRIRSLFAAGLVVASVAALTSPRDAGALIAPGAVGPGFTKTALSGGSTSLSDYGGKVVVLFLFGATCPVCLGDGPSVQQDLNLYYQAQAPGEVQVIGVDLWNKTPAEVNSFKNTTGATYPLLLYGATATGGNVETLYGPWDNYVILNKQGVVRYHAALTYAHGNRYHLNEIRATVDSLVAPTVGVEDGVLARDGALRVSPNPFLTSAAIEFSAATPLEGEITIHDVQGRRIATLWRGAVDASGVRATWDGRGDSGPAAPGVYIVRARAGDRVLHRRIVRVR